MSTENFECACHTEMLRAYRDEDGSVELAFWQYGNERPVFRHRLRHVWRIVRRGTPYSDMVILRSEDMDRLVGWWLHGDADHVGKAS